MKKLVLATSLLAAGLVFAEEGFLDRKPGIKIGERLTIRPYVSFSYTFDSNPDGGSHGNYNSSYWTVNPGADFDFSGENWKLTGLAYYMYHAFSSGDKTSLNNDSYGEQLGYTWTNIENGGAGWAVQLSERYTRIDQSDDANTGGKGLWRDRQEFDASAVVLHRFNERWHSSINAGYYWLDYANDFDGSYGPLYGWNRWSGGVQIGYTASKWTDIFVAGGYQRYRQDLSDCRIGASSEGWTAHVGIGSYMTERIEYRVSGGVSTFNYGEGAGKSNGFTYEGSLRWKIGETWATTLLFSSYYHPSEREYGSAVRCDSVSWGIAKTMVRGKLNSTFDVAFRRDTNEYSYNGGASDWDLNLLSARFSVNYNINRLLTLFARAEFQQEFNKGSIGSRYDYDRWRATFGVKFTY